MDRYNLKGPDGKDYLDLTGEILRLWLEQGRIQRTALVTQDGGATWLTVDQALNLQPAPTVPCLNHPDREAVCTCHLGAESFCASCVDSPGAFATCRACRTSVSASEEPEATAATVMAKEALTFAIISIFCFGFILAPVALFKAREAKKLAESHPRPSLNMNNAVIAQVIGGIVIAMYSLIFLNAFIKASH
jgi:hypothetical protein